MNTLTYDTYKDYCSKFKNGIRKISQECHLLTIEKHSLDLLMEKMDYNTFELYFESNGRLTGSIHREKLETYKVNYSYNRKGYLISAICSLTSNCELHSISEFSYDSKGRIEYETVRRFRSYSNSFSTEEHIHTYSENKEIVIYLGHNDDDYEYIFYNTYDLNQRLIESLAIRDAEEIIAWERHEYDDSSDLIKSIDLNQYGEISDITEYYYFRDGLKSVYIRRSNDSNSMQEFYYTIDDKGNWINKMNIKNGEPKYVYTREIMYF